MKTGRSPAQKGNVVADELSNELWLLTKQRNIAITECDFAKVRAIDCHIDRLKEEIAINKSSTNRLQAELVFDGEKEKIRMQAAKRLQKTREKIFAVQAAYQRRLMELHYIHSDELTKYADDYAASLELEATRVVPEAVYLQRQAQYNAKQRNYGAAAQLFEQSNQARVEKTDKQQEDVKVLYEGRKDRILKRQEEENSMCLAKQDQEIEMIEKEFEKKLAKYKNRIYKTGTKLGFKVTEDDYAFLNEFCLTEGQMINTPTKETPRMTPVKPSPHLNGSTMMRRVQGSAASSSARKRTPVTPRSIPRSPMVTPR